MPNYRPCTHSRQITVSLGTWEMTMLMRTLDIIDAYVIYSIYDGTIVLIDKEFNVVQVYTDETAAETLSSKIYKLLEFDKYVR